MKTGEQLHEETLNELHAFMTGRISVEEVTPLTPEEADALIEYYRLTEPKE
jgi:hypothetical protein